MFQMKMILIVCSVDVNHYQKWMHCEIGMFQMEINLKVSSMDINHYQIKKYCKIGVCQMEMIKYMFCGCTSLLYINALQNWNVSRGKKFENKFFACSLYQI